MEDLTRRMFSIIDSTADFVATTDASRRVSFLNRAGRRMIGAGDRENLSHYLIDDFHPDWARNDIAGAAEVAVRVGNWLGQTALLSRSGQEIPVSELVTAHKNDRGEVEFLSTIARDITEQVQSVQQLQQSEDQYRDLVESSHELICTHDLDGWLLSFNRGSATLMGYDQSELVGKRTNVRELLAPEVRDEFDDYLARIRANGWAKGLMLVQTRNGERRIWAYDNTLRTEGVSAPIVRGMAYDITARTRVEKDLRRKNQLMRVLEAIAAAANQAVTIEAPAQTALDQICALAQWPIGHLYLRDNSKAELVSSGLWHLDDPERYAAFKRITEATRVPLGRGLPGRVIEDGRPAWILELATDDAFSRARIAAESGLKAGYGFPVRIGDETVAATEFFSVSSDPPEPALLEVMDHVGLQLGRVIERKRAEEALRAAEARYRDLFENANDAIYTCDLSGRITSANKKLEQLTGYAAGELIGLNVWTVIAPENADRNLEFIGDQVVGLAQTTTTEVVTIGKDGSSVPLEVSSRLIYEGGRAVAVQSIARDVSDRRQALEERLRLEDQLVHAQKMESVGQLAGGVAHDFNNLLTAIIGFSQILLERFELTDPMRCEAEEILRAGRRAATLTEQLLAFSRRQEIQPRRIDLCDTINDVSTMLRRIIGADVDVLVQIAPRLPAVIADPVQVEQVIMNLAVNARDAMPNGGQLAIQTRDVILDRDYCLQNPWARPGRFVEIAVVDHGEGMDTEGLKRIFEPFYTTKEPGKGTGLGLSVVYGIVKQHNGLIYVSSELGEGTTFKVFLPVDEGPVEEALRLSETPLCGGTETILVAEDEEALLKLSTQFLTELGYTVLQARDGYEALKVYEAHQDRIDLVLLDLLMPRVNGREVFERIRATGREIPTIFLTGYAPEAMRQTFSQNLNSPLIQKPFGIMDLGRKVREVLDAASFSEKALSDSSDSSDSNDLSGHGAKRARRARKSNFLGKRG